MLDDGYERGVGQNGLALTEVDDLVADGGLERQHDPAKEPAPGVTVTDVSLGPAWCGHEGGSRASASVDVVADKPEPTRALSLRQPTRTRR